MDYMKAALLVTVVVTIFVAGIVFIAFQKFYSSIKPEKNVSKITPSEYSMEYENVTLKTSDGIELDAWYVPSLKDTNRTIVVLHGYPYDKGNVFPMSTFLHDEFNLLLFDFRYMGRSGGSYTSIGFHEKKDLEAAVKYLRNERNQSEIGLFGFSMGGAVALMEAENGKVDAVVADSSYASLNLMIAQNYETFSVLKGPLTLLTRAIAMITLKVDPCQVSPEDSIKSLEIPVIIIHSSGDAEIKVEHAYRLKNANPDVILWVIEQDRHTFASPERESEYKRRVLAFFRENLN